MNNGVQLSKYLKYLPSIYQMGKADTPSFIGRFLKAFEKVLSGISEPAEGAGEDLEPAEGIEEVLDRIPLYFDPLTTPAEFLPWLAGWVALTLKEEEGWQESKKRKHIAQIVSLYKKRGTRDGLEEYIRIYVNDERVKVSINEFLIPLRVGFHSTVGIDTLVGQGRPYYFHVYMELPEPDPVLLIKKGQAIVDIIDQEKPAYTYYGLTIKIPTMQIGVYSTIGLNTLLGGIITK